MRRLLEIIILEDLPLAAKQKNRNLFMPGDGRYQPDELKPFLGYDMWAGFLVIVEWFYLVTLAEIGLMPPAHAALLTREQITRLLTQITTTVQDKMEYLTKQHDILALLELMRRYLPKPLHRYLHLGLTSYDTICTAYALILQQTFKQVFWLKLKEVDQVWREKIELYARTVQAGRTHLQTALPVTVGCWLAKLHHDYVSSAQNAYRLALEVPGKLTGAVGTSAALKAMLNSQEKKAEAVLMDFLGLKPAPYSTQITSPQDTARFYFELVLLSGILANLGEDVRLLQSSQFGEITSASSSSSTMAHKANPILAENICGLHVNVTAEFMKVAMTLISDLQRDLRWSSVMRGFSAIMVYGYQQIITAEKLLNSLAINQERIEENFNRESKLVMAELLQLCLQRQGYAGAHELVNKTIVPSATKSGGNLPDEMKLHLGPTPDKKLKQAWDLIPANLIDLMKHPEQYLGNAIELALTETENRL